MNLSTVRPSDDDHTKINSFNSSLAMLAITADLMPALTGVSAIESEEKESKPAMPLNDRERNILDNLYGKAKRDYVKELKAKYERS